MNGEARGLRLAELLAALSLATDLGMGQPLEQALRTCLIALQIGERLGLSTEDLSDIYYVALLRFLGCTADAHEFAELVGGDDIGVRAAIAPVLGGPPTEFASGVMPKIGAGHAPVRRAVLVLGMMRSGKERVREGMRAHCELGERLAQRLGLTAGVRAGLEAAFEQWNGQGLPNGLVGEQIPLAARIVFVARDVEILHRLNGIERTRAAVRRRQAQRMTLPLPTRSCGPGPTSWPALRRARLGMRCWSMSRCRIRGSLKAAWTPSSKRSRISST